MRIEDATQTVGGHPVIIHNPNMGGQFPVHGAVWTRTGTGSHWWRPIRWDEHGTPDLPDPNCELRLDLHDWRDDIPWGCLRDEIQWVARNRHNEWIGFANRPRHDALTGTCHGTSIGNLSAVKMPSGPEDWREAIAERPETNNQKSDFCACGLKLYHKEDYEKGKCGVCRGSDEE